MSLIKCEELSLSYDSGAVVSELSFEVNAGDYLCVLGENGTGKSTLIKGILGLIKPSGGEIRFGDGLDRRKIGYLPQQTAAQRDFPASVYEIVLSGCLSRSGFFYSREDKHRAEEAMKRLDILSLRKSSYHELSGGQQQRVLLARALCAAERLIVLDEPVSGLDPRAAAEMYSVIDTLNKRDGMTVIMISHDLRGSLKYASHILHLGHEERFFGTKEEYISAEGLMQP